MLLTRARDGAHADVADAIHELGRGNPGAKASISIRVLCRAVLGKRVALGQRLLLGLILELGLVLALALEGGEEGGVDSLGLVVWIRI